MLLQLLADAGFDSESNHQLCRAEHGILSLMPAKHGRPAKGSKPPAGHWRKRMRWLLRTKRGRKRSGYTQRWQVETAVSMIKRNLGDELTGLCFWSRCRQMRLRTIVHNIMILLLISGFSTEHTCPVIYRSDLWLFMALPAFCRVPHE